MAYTRELINEVKELYPNDHKMKRKVILYQKWCEQDPRRQ